jgi:hypothetical protein
MPRRESVVMIQRSDDTSDGRSGPTDPDPGREREDPDDPAHDFADRIRDPASATELNTYLISSMNHGPASSDPSTFGSWRSPHRVRAA